MGVFEHLPYANFHNMNLDWILEHIKEFKAVVDDMEEWKQQHQEEYQELKDLYDDLIAGRLPEELENSIYTWLRNNASDVIQDLIQMVFFGLTDSGYFVAFIPETWDDIIFNTTGLDITDPGVGYGHLTLSY